MVGRRQKDQATANSIIELQLEDFKPLPNLVL
jgi:hypothetical protein